MIWPYRHRAQLEAKGGRLVQKILPIEGGLKVASTIKLLEKMLLILEHLTQVQEELITAKKTKINTWTYKLTNPKTKTISLSVLWMK